MAGDRQNWSLTRDALAGLLHFLDADPDRAAAEYERIRRRLMQLFRWRGCLAFEEYTDITVDRVARRIAEGAEFRTANPYALFHGVALNVIREHWRQSEREQRALNDLSRSREPQADAEQLQVRQLDDRHHAARAECVRQCLGRLPADSLTLIKRYYAGGETLDKEQRKRIAGELRISVNALRVRAHRIRADIAECVGACLGRTNPSVK